MNLYDKVDCYLETKHDVYKQLCLFCISVIKDDAIHWCYWSTQQEKRFECKLIEKSNALQITPTARGVWWVQKDGKVGFRELTKSPAGVYIPSKKKDFTVSVKEIRKSLMENYIYALLTNGSLVVHGGLTDVLPYGLSNDWVVFPVNGDKLYDHANGILVETKTGELLERSSKQFFVR